MTTKSDVSVLEERLQGAPELGNLLSTLQHLYPTGVRFSTSFGKEDQVLSDAISRHAPSISLFTLDTGRLFEETYSVWAATQERLGLSIAAYSPDANQLQDYLNAKGPNAFYESIENRKECCRIRKVEPLKRALKGAEVWITGLRQSQSEARSATPLVEWDESFQLIKVHPLLLWSESDVDAYISAHNVPVNRLHAKGYPSIGCAPCTRAVQPGQDLRAGRWWWETASKKECGLHVK